MKGNESLANLCCFCKNLVEQTEKISQSKHEHYYVGFNHTYKRNGLYFNKRRICMITGQDVYDLHIVKCSEHRDSRRKV